MFFNAEDDDQDFMGPEGGRSKLGSLFGMDKASNQGGNESLTYTAPKQPKKKEATPDGGTAPAVVIVTVVHAYKLVDGHYASQGKLGATILANHVSKDYRILLYVSKQKQVTNAKITPAFNYQIQPNNYASFYDEGRMNWSVMFDKEETACKFAKEVALAKANSAGPGFDSVVIQDMVVGEGGALEVGDSAEIQYTGWVMTNGTVGQVFDSNANSDKFFRFKLGKGKVIKGWETGILGMKKGGKRFLVVSPQLGYGSQGKGDKIPANSTLIFEVFVIRVKLQKGDSPSESPAATPVPIPTETTDSGWDNETVKGRSRSISEQLSQSPKSDKAKLISRMAKMGQPMLPMSGAVPAQVEDDELSEIQDGPYTDPSYTKPALARKPDVHQATPQVFHQPVEQPVGPPIHQPMAQVMTQAPPQYQTVPGQPAFLQNLPGAQQLSVYQPTNLLQQQQQAAMLQQQNMAAGFQPAGFQQPGVVPGQQFAGMSFVGSAAIPPTTATSQPSTVDALVPVLLSETRQQNTEVRLSVSKMADKVDKILEKVDHMSYHGPGSALTQTSLAPTMETGVLLQNITRIVQENETLKKDVFEKSGKIEAQNDKIAELLQKNQRFAEQSNTLLEERNEGYKYSADQSQAKVLTLEQEKVKLATELSSVSADLSTLQLEMTNVRKSEADLRQRLKTAEDQILRKEEEYSRIKLQALDDEKKVSELTSSLRDEKHHRKSLESKLNQTQEELGDLKSSNESLERNLTERKRKANEERRKLEEDMEDMKMNLESEVQSLRDRLRKQKTSVDVATADKVAKLEEDIAQEWQEKCDKLLKSAEEKHSRVVRDVEEDRDTLQQKIKELEAKIQAMRSSTGSSEQLISQLQDKVDDLSMWKDKYENLRNQATSMKERYEEKIGDLEEERDAIMDKGRQLQMQNQQLQQSLKQAQTQVHVQTSGDQGAGSQDVASEVKKIMNNVYRGLREEFDSDESYTGSEILAIILNAIKTTTLSLVKTEAGGTAQEEEEEEEEEEEDESEDEEQIEHVEQATKDGHKLEETKTEEEEVPEGIVKTDSHVIETASVDSEVSETMSTTDSHLMESSSMTNTVGMSVEQIITASSMFTSGDHGNRLYSNTLDKMSEPVIRQSSSYVTGDHGNSCYSNELNMLEQLPGPVTGNHRNQNYSKTLTDLDRTIEPVIESASTFVTGDHGNRYHSIELDASGQIPAIKEVVESSVSPMTCGHGNRAYRDDMFVKLDKSAVVEEIFESSNIDMLGDTGNPSHIANLDQLKSQTEVPAHDRVVEEVVFKTKMEITGAEGNPYHSRNLDIGDADFETATKSTESEATKSEIKTSLQEGKTQEQVSNEMGSSSDEETVYKDTSEHVEIGDHDETELDSNVVPDSHVEKMSVQEEQNEDFVKDSSSEPDTKDVVISETVDNKSDSTDVIKPNTVDKSDLVDNTSYSVDSKSDLVDNKSDSVENTSDSLNEKSDKGDSKFDMQDVVKSDAVNKDDSLASIQLDETLPIDPLGGLTNGIVANSTLATSKDRSSSSASSGKNRSRSSSDKSEGLPTLASREPPPLFGDDDDDDDDSLLFGPDNTVTDTQQDLNSEQDGDKSKKVDIKDNKKSKLPSKADLTDDDMKPTPPPPLFGDDDDDDDLDWLS
ncbi:FK506-binding protein 15-like isoform X1 [Gigantopelta aegis]|uniref:FK506-binding protein 15-like isoform X1 n=1 Tax=Gigantopelta aegis TaxID=1735272 RepID=UPI001B887F54|nr:FK506-binding protein 15-like isoform X1 [Gigantopelta aegis]